VVESVQATDEGGVRRTRDETIRARLGLCAILFLGLFFGPLATAQQAERVRRVGFLSAPTPSPAMIDAFRDGLRESGYVEGRNVLIEWRSAEGKAERLSGLAAELVSLKAEVIVTFASQATLAAKKATTEIPIVFTQVGDPVGLGIVTSLARPGANVTGLTNVIVDLTRKRLELTREVVPGLKSVAILTDPMDPLNTSYLKETGIAARELGLEVRVVDVRRPEELGPAFTTIVQARTQAVVLAPGPFIFTHRMEIATLAVRARVPVVGWDRELAESGALISYGPKRLEMLRRAAVYTDKILKGAKPADLPVEGPTEFELVVNLKTAKALGVTIPKSVLFRADDVMK
jgi:putative ABC transport system substrate-binding protein